MEYDNFNYEIFEYASSNECVYTSLDFQESQFNQNINLLISAVSGVEPFYF